VRLPPVKGHPAVKGSDADLKAIVGWMLK